MFQTITDINGIVRSKYSKGSTIACITSSNEFTIEKAIANDGLDAEITSHEASSSLICTCDGCRHATIGDGIHVTHGS